MPRPTAIWIHSQALPPLPAGGISLAFASDMILPFANLKAAQACAQEIVGVLQRHGFSVGSVAAESDPGGVYELRSASIWIQAEALPPLPPNGSTLRFAGGLMLPFADTNVARNCEKEIVSALSGRGFEIEIRDN